MPRGPDEDRTGARGKPLVGLPVGPEAPDDSPRLVEDDSPRLVEVAVAARGDRQRGDLVSPFDARFLALSPADLSTLIDRLVEAFDERSVDVVLAISESGVVPAYAFAAATDRPFVMATEVDAELPQAITFEAGSDPLADQARSRRIYPLSRGDRVVIVEHHTVTGSSALSCIGVLRAEGIVCDQLVTLLAADDEMLRARMTGAGVVMTAAALMPGAITGLLYRDGEPHARRIGRDPG